ncbi:MAG TPA: ABC transporter ATP-binding protein [Acidobacteriota bacterium]|nr:ABC transporter ATP-binding protein [Acidobacteriota bacterium]
MSSTELKSETASSHTAPLQGGSGTQAQGQVLIALNKLNKIYQKGGEQVHALQDIDLTIHEGEFISLMGPSGSGKTTLLNILAGIDQPTSGTIHLSEIDLSSLSESQLADWRNHHVGFIFQHFNLIPVLTAYENVELPLLLTSLSKKERQQHVVTALDLVGLSDRVKHYPRQLSGGQEQRVSIARAIVTDPSFILADEPTGDLDAESANEVLEILKGLNQDYGKTIIMVTHDPRAADYASARYHLDKGILTRE